jgi:hypothetical protein
VLELAGDPSLFAEPSQKFGPIVGLGPEHLDGQFAVKLTVVDAIDNAHAAAGDFVEQLIPRAIAFEGGLTAGSRIEERHGTFFDTNQGGDAGRASYPCLPESLSHKGNFRGFCIVEGG